MEHCMGYGALHGALHGVLHGALYGYGALHGAYCMRYGALHGACILCLSHMLHFCMELPPL